MHQHKYCPPKNLHMPSKCVDVARTIWGIVGEGAPRRVRSLAWPSGLLAHALPSSSLGFFSGLPLCVLHAVGPELSLRPPLPACFPTLAPLLALCLWPRMSFHTLRIQSLLSIQDLVQRSSVSQSFVTRPRLGGDFHPPWTPWALFPVIVLYSISSLTSSFLRAEAVPHFSVLHCPSTVTFVINELMTFLGHTQPQVISCGP